MNVSNVGRNSVFVGRAWLLGGLYVDPCLDRPEYTVGRRRRYVIESAVRAPMVLDQSRGE